MHWRPSHLREGVHTHHATVDWVPPHSRLRLTSARVDLPHRQLMLRLEDLPTARTTGSQTAAAGGQLVLRHHQLSCQNVAAWKWLRPQPGTHYESEHPADLASSILHLQRYHQSAPPCPQLRGLYAAVHGPRTLQPQTGLARPRHADDLGSSSTDDIVAIAPATSVRHELLQIWPGRRCHEGPRPGRCPCRPLRSRCSLGPCRLPPLLLPQLLRQTMLGAPLLLRLLLLLQALATCGRGANRCAGRRSQTVIYSGHRQSAGAATETDVHTNHSRLRTCCGARRQQRQRQRQSSLQFGWDSSVLRGTSGPGPAAAEITPRGGRGRPVMVC